MLGIIGAMSSEVDGLIHLMSNVECKDISGVKFHKGYVNGNKIVVAKAGVGKVNAAVTAQTMILKYNVNAIINIGVAGSIEKSLKIGDIVVADKVVEHDMDTTCIGEPAGFIGGIDKVYMDADADISRNIYNIARNMGFHVVMGTIASGDIFVADNKVRNKIEKLFNAYAAEMEGAAIGHTCTMNNVPFAVLRTMSDGANGDSPEDFPVFAQKAADNAIKIIYEYIVNMDK